MRKIPLVFHSHFYQPPRENPFTGKIPSEYGSGAYGNFNEKIFHECYLPNLKLGNISNMSFNLGPTLAQWMEKYHPDTLAEYVKVDETITKKYGNGNAIAQAYNHCILPLLDEFDKRVQIYWGICEFKRVYGREPLGFWFPETAIDQSTLDLLPEYGIKYTFLAPWQVEFYDPVHRPATLKTADSSITAFIYDDPLTRLFISYMPRFTARGFRDFSLMSRIYQAVAVPRDVDMIAMAIDGEFLGHHRANRAEVLSQIFKTYPSKLPIQFLDKSNHFVSTRLVDDTSWSCFSKLQRWRGKCELKIDTCVYQPDCYINDNSWTELLWDIMVDVKTHVYSVFREFAQSYFDDPNKLIMEYIRYYHKEITFKKLCEICGIHSEMNIVDQKILKNLLEGIYYCQLMFTSCGFFFEDVDRIEPKNNIRYLKKAFSLVNEYLECGFEDNVIKQLEAVKSYRKPKKNAASFY